MRFRTSSSPSRYSTESRISMPRNSECRNNSWSRAESEGYSSRSTSMGARPSTSCSTFPWQRVAIIGLPTGRHPCATMVSTATFPARATPASPLRCARAPRKTRFAPGTGPPLASPPTLLAAGYAASSPAISASASTVSGSTSRTKCGRVPGSTSIVSRHSCASALSGSSRWSRWNDVIRTPGSEAAVSDSAGASSTSWPAPMMPRPVQPARSAPGSAASTIAGRRADASRWCGETNATTGSTAAPASPRRTSAAASATASSACSFPESADAQRMPEGCHAAPSRAMESHARPPRGSAPGRK